MRHIKHLIQLNKSVKKYKNIIIKKKEPSYLNLKEPNYDINDIDFSDKFWKQNEKVISYNKVKLNLLKFKN